LHGDDAVLDGFYQEMEEMFRNFPEAEAAFTRYAYIDANGNVSPPGKTFLDQPGILKDFLFQIAQRQMLQAAAMVVKRSVYERLGSFYAVHYGEDWEMWIRIAANFPVAYSPVCLALYRGGQDHNTSITSSYISTGQNIKDINKVIEIAQNYLPGEKRAQLKRMAKKNYSMHYAQAASSIYQYNPKAAFKQANSALKMHVNARTVYWVLRLYLTHLQKLVFKEGPNVKEVVSSVINSLFF
jgi:hypothetical protein